MMTELLKDEALKSKVISFLSDLFDSSKGLELSGKLEMLLDFESRKAIVLQNGFPFLEISFKRR